MKLPKIEQEVLECLSKEKFYEPMAYNCTDQRGARKVFNNAVTRLRAKGYKIQSRKTLKAGYKLISEPAYARGLAAEVPKGFAKQKHTVHIPYSDTEKPIPCNPHYTFDKRMSKTQRNGLYAIATWTVILGALAVIFSIIL